MAQERKIKNIFFKKNNFQLIHSSTLNTFLNMLKVSFDAFILTNINVEIIEVHSNLQANLAKNKSLSIPYRFEMNSTFFSLIKSSLFL